MNFGIFVRSVGERTEQLCLESCYQCLPRARVHLLKNYYPSYNVYRAMFSEAIRRRYGWYMGLDADVILMPGALDAIEERIRELDDEPDVFKFTCRLHDKFLPHAVDRGNHVYSARFNSLAWRALRNNIWLTRLGRLSARLGARRGFYLKPETAIRTRLRESHGIRDVNFDDVIGWHGFEQYYSHIFHRFVVRANRNPEYEEKYPFLRKESADALSHRDDKDWLVANLGWQYGKANKVYKVDARRCNAYRDLLEKEGIREKPALDTTLADIRAVRSSQKWQPQPGTAEGV
jgi:hypothetical protein